MRVKERVSVLRDAGTGMCQICMIKESSECMTIRPIEFKR